METLALLGGQPVFEETIPAYCSLGVEEREAVNRVMNSKVLSGFYGSLGDNFAGGAEVKRFEAKWCELFSVKHAVSMNSATSCLVAALGAVGIVPGDEIIVPPYTMSATAMAPLMVGGLPVFVDIEPDTFCLDPNKVREAITKRTKAILVVNLFGHPAQLKELRKIADEYDLKLIEDNAQSIGATEHGHFTGTIGHIGVFSLNYHKHIHAGEGGVCLTDDNDLALRLQMMIRNHGENVVGQLKIQDISGLVGANYRLTELSAAIGLAQLANLDLHVGHRVQAAEKILAGLADLPGIILPTKRNQCTHAYYLLAFRVKKEVLGCSREWISKALFSEGLPHFTGYVAPLYRLPVFQQKIAYGKYPFCLSDIDYKKVKCPVTEKMYHEEFLGFELCMYDLNDKTIEKIIQAVRKVIMQAGKLEKLGKKDAATYSS